MTPPISYIINNLWPTIGFNVKSAYTAHFDDEQRKQRQEMIEISEYFLIHFILKHSDSLDEVNLKSFKEMFNFR
jgi:hypothetical protein